MPYHYSRKSDENDTHRLPDVETFEVWSDGPVTHNGWEDEDGDMVEDGWYWQSCQPGCMPDGDPVGPFGTEAEALEDARSCWDDDDDEPVEPQPEDYCVGPRGDVWQHDGARVGRWLESEDQAAAIRKHAGGNFWPNVWTMDDHGGWCLWGGFDWDGSTEPHIDYPHDAGRLPSCHACYVGPCVCGDEPGLAKGCESRDCVYPDGEDEGEGQS